MQAYKMLTFTLWLMHYPVMSCPRFHHVSLHLHGHIHSKGDYNLQQKSDVILRYDVGVDVNGFYSVSIEQVKGFFWIGLGKCNRKIKILFFNFTNKVKKVKIDI